VNALRITLIIPVVIFFTIIWLVLGAKMDFKTKQVSLKAQDSLVGNWGSSITQEPPSLVKLTEGEEFVAQPTSPPPPDVWEEEQAEYSTEQVTPPATQLKPQGEAVPFSKENITVNIDADYRKKGLITFNTYSVEFGGEYSAVNDTDQVQRWHFSFPLSQTAAMLYDLSFTVNGEQATDDDLSDGFDWEGEVANGEQLSFSIEYSARGIDSWLYSLAGRSLHNEITLDMTVNQTKNDIPDTSLSPVEVKPTEDGERLLWTFQNLMSDKSIGINIPKAENHFLTVRNLTYWMFLPFLLYVTALTLMLIAKKKELHPLHYLFLGGAFVSFSLLLAYILPYWGLWITFAIAVVASIAMTLTYLARLTSTRFAVWDGGKYLYLFLVGFPISFFTEYRGIVLVLIGVVALILLMQDTVQHRWGGNKKEKEGK